METDKEKQEKLIVKMMKNDEELGLYATPTNTEKLLEEAREQAEKAYDYGIQHLGTFKPKNWDKHIAFIKGAQFIINKLNKLQTK